MSEPRLDIQPIKPRLEAYRERDNDIELYTESLERLREKLAGIGAKELTGMPRSPSPPTDRMTDLIYRISELEANIARIIGEQYEERHALEVIITEIISRTAVDPEVLSREAVY